MTGAHRSNDRCFTFLFSISPLFFQRCNGLARLALPLSTSTRGKRNLFKTHCVLCLGSSEEATSCGDTANAAAPEVGCCTDEDAPPPAPPTPFTSIASAADGGRASGGPAHPGPSASACERGLAYIFMEEKRRERFQLDAFLFFPFFSK